MKTQQDVIIVGGGIMGLMTAYYASLLGKKVIILERLVIGNKKAGSFSLTRSIRNDYIDPLYAKLANEACELWKQLEEESLKRFLIDCGCLNLIKNTITPNSNGTYAMKSFKTLQELGYDSEIFQKEELKKFFPQFLVDRATLDKNAGVLYLPEITKTLLKLLEKKKVKIWENVHIAKIEETKNLIIVKTTTKIFYGKSLVLTPGIWVNNVVKLIANCSLQFPITPDRPKQCKYFILPKDLQELFSPSNFPVFAYLDIGIYGHPFLKGKTKGVKIGYYNPMDIKKAKTTINNIDDFIAECLPVLKNVKSIDVKDADQCFYENVSDDEFILGKLPGFRSIFVGCGWRGTGYKFAPLIGNILSDLSVKNKTSYPIERFNPDRFTKRAKIDKI